MFRSNKAYNQNYLLDLKVQFKIVNLCNVLISSFYIDKKDFKMNYIGKGRFALNFSLALEFLIGNKSKER